jgi:hypothetical protein
MNTDYNIVNIIRDSRNYETTFDMITITDIMNCKAVFNEENKVNEFLVFNIENQAYESIINLFSEPILEKIKTTIQH